MLLGLVGTAVVAAGGAAVFAAAVMPADATVVAAGPSGAKPTRTPVDTALTRLTAWHAAENAAAQSGSPASSSTCM